MIEIEPRLAKELRAKYDRILATSLPPRLASFNPAADHRRRRALRGLNLFAAVAVVAVVIAILTVPIVLGIQSRHETPAVRPHPTATVSPGPPLHHNGQVLMSEGRTLVALDEATGAEHVIFSASAAKVAGPAYSPDGTQIAYLQGGAPGEHSIGGMDSIWVLDTRKGQTRQLTTCAGCNEADSISWSPDGSRLAFAQADQRGILQLDLIDADGTHKTQLTHLPGLANAYQPTWSPDGTRIAFASQNVVNQDVSSLPVNIDVINTDGTGLAVIVAGVGESRALGQRNLIFPAWSPNGSRIGYVVDPPQPGPSFEQFQLWLMNPDGTHRTEIFRFDGCCGGGGSLGGPVWSPDGTRIAIDAFGTVWLVNPGGSAVKVPSGLVSGLLGGGTAWQPVP